MVKKIMMFAQTKKMIAGFKYYLLCLAIFVNVGLAHQNDKI